MAQLFDKTPKKADGLSNSSISPTTANKENGTMTETDTSTLGDHDGQVQQTKELSEIPPPTVVQHDNQTESTHLVGMKLYIMLVGVGATLFLMMLDQTIVVTVRSFSSSCLLL